LRGFVQRLEALTEARLSTQGSQTKAIIWRKQRIIKGLLTTLPGCYRSRRRSVTFGVFYANYISEPHRIKAIPIDQRRFLSAHRRRIHTHWLIQFKSMNFSSPNSIRSMTPMAAFLLRRRISHIIRKSAPVEGRKGLFSPVLHPHTMQRSGKPFTLSGFNGYARHA
jgi:hypothetical protein